MPETYIERTDDGRYEFGVFVRRNGVEHRIVKGTGLKHAEAEHLLQFIGEVLNENGR